ncbi:MAG: transaldolase [Parcubacteria group bacterium Gr01-1014_46]|nr:MAG: transaldolase [Parcubacteria group bacterium Gr01-1014_46]
MRISGLKTKIFLDSGDPIETQDVLNKMGFLDGQTTNPTLISKNPDASKRLESGDKFSKEGIFNFYKETVSKISKIIPQGSVSVEVYADQNTTYDEMLEMGRSMYLWIPNAHIKFPTTKAGLAAANTAVSTGMRVNMTLVFSQVQAAAVYCATVGANIGESLAGFKNVFVSPFVGRLDDRGENGMDLVKNIIQMYSGGDGHVEVLTASVRNLSHFKYAIKLGSNIITAPYKVLMEWVDDKMSMPDSKFKYDFRGFAPIAYEFISLEEPFGVYNIDHDLTKKGIEKFSSDWNSLVKS